LPTAKQRTTKHHPQQKHEKGFTAVPTKAEVLKKKNLENYLINR